MCAEMSILEQAQTKIRILELFDIPPELGGVEVRVFLV